MRKQSSKAERAPGVGVLNATDLWGQEIAVYIPFKFTPHRPGLGCVASSGRMREKGEESQRGESLAQCRYEAEEESQSLSLSLDLQPRPS